MFKLTTISSTERQTYAKTFAQEKLTSLKLLSTLETSSLRELGLPFGHAIEIRDAVRTLTLASPATSVIAPTVSSPAPFTSSPKTQAQVKELLAFIRESSTPNLFFVSHNWGEDELNHSRVRSIVRAFQSLGFNVWFDDECLTGDIEAQVTKGIKASAMFIAFVTKAYNEKLETGTITAKDWCWFEYKCATSQKPANMMAVVNEAPMRDSTKWFDGLSARLGSSIYADYSTDDRLDACVSAMLSVFHDRLCMPH